MPSFRDLPKEVQENIVMHLKPGDIVTYQQSMTADTFHPDAPVSGDSYLPLLNVCQASHDLKVLGQRALYSHVQIPEASRANALIRTLLEQPHLRGHVLGLTVTVVDDIQKHGGVRNFADEWARWREVSLTLFRGIEHEPPKSRAQVSRLCNIIYDDMIEHTEQLQDGGPRQPRGFYFKWEPGSLSQTPPDWASPCQYLYACLLCLLPNLREVAFVTPAGTAEWPESEVSRQGLERVLKKVLNDQEYPRPLQKLRKISFHSGGVGWDGLSHPAYPGFDTFVDLPNLRDVTADMYFHYFNQPAIPPVKLASRYIHTLHVCSNREKIKKWKDLRTLIKTSDGLQRLTLEISQRMSARPWKRDVFQYAEQLKARYLPNLTYLHLVANPPHIGRPAPINFLSMNKKTLEQLPELRHLKITGQLYMLTQYEEENDKEDSTEDILSLFNTHLKVKPHRNLAALIPSNIESFGFRETVRNGEGFVPEYTEVCPTWPFLTIADYEEWFEGMWFNLAGACVRKERPNLKRIAVYGDRFENASLAARLRRGFQDLGVEFTVLSSLEAWEKWCWSVDSIRE